MTDLLVGSVLSGDVSLLGVWVGHLASRPRKNRDH